MPSPIILEELIVAEEGLTAEREPFVKLRLKTQAPAGIGDSLDSVLVSVTIRRRPGMTLEQFQEAGNQQAIEVLKSALATFEAAAHKG